MRFNKGLRAIAIRFQETIEAIVGFVFLIGGLWILSPFYDAIHSTSYHLVGSDINRYLAVWQILISLPLIISYFKDSSYRLSIRSKSTFFLFITGIFYAVGLFAATGLTTARWANLLGLALIIGVCHLRLKWETA